LLEDRLLRPKTLREHTKALLTAFLFVLVPLLMLEGLLRFFDPWGIYFFDDMAKLANDFERHEQRGFYLPDGVYRFSNWQATIKDGVRAIPVANSDTDCRIVLLGDSFTFGYGVNDDETWAYHLAKQFPNVEFLNTGITAYNSYNIQRIYEQFPDATAYLYTVIYNDWEPNLDPTQYEHENPARTMPYIVRYGNFALYRAEEPSINDFTVEELLNHPKLDRFFDDIAVLATDPRVFMLGFEDTITTVALVEAGYELHQLKYPRHPISFADGHLNAKGHEVLANEITPIVQVIIEMQCP
jgi:hypothetical protein